MFLKCIRQSDNWPCWGFRKQSRGKMPSALSVLGESVAAQELVHMYYYITTFYFTLKFDIALYVTKSYMLAICVYAVYVELLGLDMT